MAAMAAICFFCFLPRLAIPALLAWLVVSTLAAQPENAGGWHGDGSWWVSSPQVSSACLHCAHAAQVAAVSERGCPTCLDAISAGADAPSACMLACRPAGAHAAGPSRH